MIKTQTLIIGGAGVLGVFVLYRMIQPKQVVYGDEFGGAPPIDQSYYFPRLGGEEPLAPFPQTAGIPVSQVGSVTPPLNFVSPADYDVLPPQDLTPKVDSNVATDCTKTCDDCSQTTTGGPFQGGPFSNPVKALGRYRSY